LKGSAERAYIAPAMKTTFMVIALFAASGAAGCRKSRTTPAPSAAAAAQALKVEDITVGQGPLAIKGKVVSLNYTGYLSDGTRFDSTQGRQPFQFQLGQGAVLKGWDLGVEGMRVGGKRKLTVPPALAFGDRTVGQIKPNSTVVFDVELVAVR
jgi:FKBP-type peptidyl-prolyl cis-trans isomerase FkpA